MEKEYRELTGEQIKETCEAHEKWLASGGKEGCCGAEDNK